MGNTCLTTGDTTKLACTTASAGFYIAGSGAEATATACTSQITGCAVDTANTCLTTGDTTKLACTTASAGFYIAGSGAEATATGCTAVADQASGATPTCTSASDSQISACDSGFFKQTTS